MSEKIKDLPTNSNSITTYKNENFGDIRVMGDANNPLFCLVDICKALGVFSTNKVARAIKREFGWGELNSPHIIDRLGRRQKAIFITEPQLYFVLMRSDKPNAKLFRQWVINRVLPQIRKQGFYSSNQYISEMFEIISQKLPDSQKNFHISFEIYDKNTQKKCSVYYEVGNAQTKQGDKK